MYLLRIERSHDILNALAREIGEQKRIDASLSLSSYSYPRSHHHQLPVLSESEPHILPHQVGAGSSNALGGITVVLPGEKEAQRKKHKAKIAYHDKGASFVDFFCFVFCFYFFLGGRLSFAFSFSFLFFLLPVISPM